MQKMQRGETTSEDDAILSFDCKSVRHAARAVGTKIVENQLSLKLREWCSLTNISMKIPEGFTITAIPSETTKFCCMMRIKQIKPEVEDFLI